MCGSMVDIQSAAAENRRGTKDERKKGETMGKIECLHLLRRAATIITRMWANAQRDGCPAEYRWRPAFNAAVFG